MTLNVEPWKLGPIWLKNLPSEHCHACGVFMVSKFKNRQNLTPMTLNVEPWKLGPIWFKNLPSEHCHACGVFMVAKFKKKKQTDKT